MYVTFNLKYTYHNVLLASPVVIFATTTYELSTIVYERSLHFSSKMFSHFPPATTPYLLFCVFNIKICFFVVAVSHKK